MFHDQIIRKAKWGKLDEDTTYISTFTARTGSLWIEEQERAEQSLLETNLPFLFIVAEKDGVVRNDTIQSYYEKAQKAGKRNEYVLIDGKWSDHTIVTMDPDLGKQVMENVVTFFDNLILEKAQTKAD